MEGVGSGSGCILAGACVRTDHEDVPDRIAVRGRHTEAGQFETDDLPATAFVDEEDHVVSGSDDRDLVVERHGGGRSRRQHPRSRLSALDGIAQALRQRGRVAGAG